MEKNEAGGTYVYAVVPKAAAPEKLEEVTGIEDGKVYSVASGELAAVVSDVPTREELRPERRLVAAHQKVLQKVTDASPAVLPVSFGTIAESADGVRELLDRYQQDFSQQIQKVEGKVEMEVRVTYSAEKPSVFDFLLAGNQELRDARDRLAGHAATREEKIDLGQKVDAVFTALREEYARRLEEAIGDRGEARSNPPRSEKEFVNLSFLVPKDRMADFDAAIQSAGSLFPDNFVVEQVGPFPPYNFVNVHVTAPSAQP